MHARTNEFPVIFCPVRPFDRYRETDEPTTPFIRAALDYSNTNVQKAAETADDQAGTLQLFKLIELQIEEMELNVHKITIMNHI